MLEIGYELLYRLNDLGFCEVILVEDRLKFIEENIHFFHPVTSRLFHHSEGLKALKPLTRNVELFEGFFASSIALEIDHGISLAVIIHRGGKPFSFSIAGTLFLGEPLRFHKVIADSAEGEHLVFSQLREKHLARSTEDTSEHTNLTTLLGADEVTLNIAGGHQGLLFLQAMDPSIRKGSFPP